MYSASGTYHIGAAANGSKPTRGEIVSAPEYTISETITHIPITDMIPGRWQPRRSFDYLKLFDLAQSLKDHQITPILVWLDPGTGKYEIVAGERRWRARAAIALAKSDYTRPLIDCCQKLAGQAPHTLDDFDTWAAGATLLAQAVAVDHPVNLYPLAFTENLDHAALSLLEEAYGVLNYYNSKNVSIRDLAAHISRSKSWVESRLDIFKLEKTALSLLEAVDPFPITLVRHVKSLDDPYQASFAAYLIDTGATERQAGVLIPLIRGFAGLYSGDLSPSGGAMARIDALYRQSWDNAYTPPDKLSVSLKERYLGLTRGVNYSGSDAAPFPRDWNPIAVAGLLDESDVDILAVSPVCEFCNQVSGVVTSFRCTNPKCWDRKAQLWRQLQRQQQKSPVPEPAEELVPEPAEAIEDPLPASTPPTTSTPSTTAPIPKLPSSPPLGGTEGGRPLPVTLSEPSPKPSSSPPMGGTEGGRPLPVMTPIPQPILDISKELRLTILIQPAPNTPTFPSPDATVLLTIARGSALPGLHRCPYSGLHDLIDHAIAELTGSGAGADAQSGILAVADIQEEVQS